MLVMNVRLPKRMRKALDIAAGREISTATHVLRRAAAYYLRAFHDLDWEKVGDHTPEDDERWYSKRLGMRLHRQSEGEEE